MKYIMTIILITTFSCLVIGQTGYFGEKNSVGFFVSGMPTFRSKYEYNPNNNIITKRHRYAYLNYGINLSRVMSRQDEISINYSFSKVKTNTITSRFVLYDTYFDTNGEIKSYYQNLNFISDPIFEFHQFNISYLKYRLGSIAPTGKYIGIGFTFGYFNVTNKETYIGLKGVELSGKANNTYNPLILEKIKIKDTKLLNFQLNTTLGRNYPITQFLTFNTSMTFPILTIYNMNGKTKARGIEENVILIFKNKGEDFSNEETLLKKDIDISSMLERSVRKYSFITINIGLKYHF